VVVYGVSKAYAMTGWRIGYAAGPKELIAAMANIQSQSTSNPSSISQKAAVAALRGGEAFTQRMVVEFDRRRRLMVERLNKMPGVSCRMPAGAFYAFAPVPFCESLPFAKALATDAAVLVIPGVAFGRAGEGFVRISFAAPIEAIGTGIERIGRWLRAAKR